MLDHGPTQRGHPCHSPAQRCPPRRPSRLRPHLAGAVLLVGLSACGSSANQGDTGICEATEGTLAGTVTLWAELGEPGAEPAEMAQVAVGQDGGDPILLYTDAEGAYAVDLPAGSWMVSAVDASGYCFPEDDITVEISACQEQRLDLALLLCVL